ncbi:MAG: DUF1254 domain-containing protein [Pseudomonadota bacterium]
MRRLIALGLFIIAAIAGHFLTLYLVPSVIMNATQTRLADQGLALNQWAAAPRMTPQAQTIVRPSPDLSYSICRFDVSEGPVLISAPGWDRYGSLSVFDEQTNNVFVANLDGEDAEVLLHAPGQAPLKDGRGYDYDGQSLELSGSGLALIRRVAPDVQSYETTVSLIEQSKCEIVQWR